MIIAICDCCNQQCKENEIKRISVDSDCGMVLIFDIGTCCFDKEFKVPATARKFPKGIIK